MIISTVEHDSCVEVAVSGALDSATAPELARALTELADAGQHYIIVDLAEVRQISSAGLRVLINAAKRLSSARGGGDLLLASPSQRVVEVLDLAGLLPVLNVFPTTDEAMASLKAKVQQKQPARSFARQGEKPR